jgi:hypothetical protein
MLSLSISRMILLVLLGGLLLGVLGSKVKVLI